MPETYYLSISDLTAASWSDGPALTTATTEYKAVNLQGRLLLFGGRLTPNLPMNTLELKPDLSSWEVKPNLVTPYGYDRYVSVSLPF